MYIVKKVWRDKHGNEEFEYLQKLDDLKDRPVDNTGFIKVEDFENLEDEEVYNMLLSQYPEWLKGLKNN